MWHIRDTHLQRLHTTCSRHRVNCAHERAGTRRQVTSLARAHPSLFLSKGNYHSFLVNVLLRMERARAECTLAGVLIASLVVTQHCQAKHVHVGTHEQDTRSNNQMNEAAPSFLASQGAERVRALKPRRHPLRHLASSCQAKPVHLLGTKTLNHLVMSQARRWVSRVGEVGNSLIPKVS